MHENDTSQESKDISSIASVIEEISGSVITVRTLKGSKKFDIGKLFNVDQNNLSEEFTTQASMYGFFAILSAEADKIVAMTSLLCDQEAAEADELYRKQLDEEGKKYTEAVIKSLVTRDEEYDKCVKAKYNAEYDLDILKAIVKAFEQRAMMLQSLGSHLRHEYEMQGMNTRMESSEKLAEESTSKVKDAIQRRKLNKTSD
jgi:hypothetical protein